jgi:Ca-activated chloride channel family protein
MCPELTSELNRPYLPVVGGQVVADVTVEPGVQTGSVTRQIALVIDTSGSMSGAKMERARNGAKFVLGYLDDDDVLCIVDFDSSAEVVLEADRFGNLGRERATERIDEMTAGGGTNIYEALEKAADELRAQPTGSDVARRILLLSDGKDNRRGPDDFDRQARDIDEHGVRIRAAGIGDEYNEETIRTLGTAARGQWRHIEEPDEIQEFFGEAVEQASTVVGTDAELRMDIAEGVEFTEAYRGAPQAQRTDVEYVGDNTGVVKLPDLLDRQTQTVQLKIQAPTGELGQRKTLADLTLHAGGETASGAIEVEYTDDDEKLSVENKDPAIAMDKTRIRTTLGRGEDDEAEKQVTKLREKHGEEAAADADRMEDEVTRVREGERGEQESATRVRDEEDRFD